LIHPAQRVHDSAPDVGTSNCACFGTVNRRCPASMCMNVHVAGNIDDCLLEGRSPKLENLA
jgi:hypothetical protein